MRQDNIQNIIAKVMEEEKQALFCYACYCLGNVEEAEDLLQDLFLNLCHTPGIVEKTKDLKSYIFRCIYNNCNSLMQHKRKMNFQSLELREVAEIEDIQPQTFEEEYTLINRLLNTIPQEQSEVIRLHIHGNKTFREISNILDFPEASVKSRYRYGIEKLRKMMKMIYSPNSNYYEKDEFKTKG